MTTSPVLSVLLSMGGSGIVVVLIQVWFQRKNVDATTTKTKAEEAKILSEGALTQLRDMRSQMADVRASMKAHREWDREMTKRLRELDPTAELPDPPELFV